MNKEQQIEGMIKDISILQIGYQKLLDERKLTKKALCELVIPFRDKYKLTDKAALMLARDEMTFQELSTVLSGGQIDKWKI
jgi:hypothetical protein